MQRRAKSLALEEVCDEEPCKQDCRPYQSYDDSDPNKEDLLLMALVWGGNPHDIVEDTHHCQERFQSGSARFQGRMIFA